jgi:hypothetical protein
MAAQEPAPPSGLDLQAEIITRDRRIEQLRVERDAFAKNFDLLKVRSTPPPATSDQRPATSTAKVWQHQQQGHSRSGREPSTTYATTTTAHACSGSYAAPSCHRTRTRS